MCGTCQCLCVQRPEEDIRCPFAVILAPLPWDKASHWTRSSLGASLADQQAPRILSLLPTPGDKVTYSLWGCLPLCGPWALNLDLHVCIASVLIHGVISQMPECDLCGFPVTAGCAVFEAVKAETVCTRQQGTSWVGRIEEILPVLVRICNLSPKAMNLESISMSYPQHGWNNVPFPCNNIVSRNCIFSL